MTGWNMPPGVNESDIPGNRPQDIEYERTFDDLVAELKDLFEYYHLNAPVELTQEDLEQATGSALHYIRREYGPRSS